MDTTVIDAGLSEEVIELVRIIQRLDDHDQWKMLRIASLLTVASTEVQRVTQRKLKQLLGDGSITALECLRGVDEIIDYLEDEVLAKSYEQDREAKPANGAAAHQYH